MLAAIFNKEIVTNKAACRIIGVAAFVILTALGALVRIPLPFTPVPFTLQTFFVLLSGAFLGSTLGAVAQASYILLGVLGLPIFNGASSGIFYLFGPTGGYIFGFIVAALLAGRFLRYSKNDFLMVFIILCVADLVLLSCGVIWLKLTLGYPFKRLILIGFIPFIPADLLKAGIAAAIFMRLRKRVREIF